MRCYEQTNGFNIFKSFEHNSISENYPGVCAENPRCLEGFVLLINEKVSRIEIVEFRDGISVRIFGGEE